MMTAAVLATEPETKQQERQMPTPLFVATIRAARAGDQRAFEEIMLLTERKVALLAWRILGDAEEVKEATQETFLRVFRHLSRYDETRDFNGWLFRIAVNVCRDLEKKRRKRGFFFSSIDDVPEIARENRLDAQLESRRDAALLAEAIDSLPPKERLAVILRDVEELTTEEVAEILGSRPATVRVQISKARVKLREWIDRRRKGARP